MGYIALIGTGFWVFLTVTAVSGLVFEYKKRGLELEPLRAAIERGQQLDPAIIERLMQRDRQSSELEPLHFRVGGIMTIAGGIGFGLLSLVIGRLAEKAFLPLLGVGGVALCVGIGLLITAGVIERQPKALGTRERGA
jgi:hypothetical protein